MRLWKKIFLPRFSIPKLLLGSCHLMLLVGNMPLNIDFCQRFGNNMSFPKLDITVLWCRSEVLQIWLPRGTVMIVSARDVIFFKRISPAPKPIICYLAYILMCYRHTSFIEFIPNGRQQLCWLSQNLTQNCMCSFRRRQNALCCFLQYVNHFTSVTYCMRFPHQDMVWNRLKKCLNKLKIRIKVSQQHYYIVFKKWSVFMLIQE